MESIKVTQEVYDKIENYLDSNTNNTNLDFMDYVIGTFKMPKESE